MNYTKYPRTFHAPWSEGATSDDKTHKDMSAFEDQWVVCSFKMDGENFTGYNDGHCHARSIDSSNHLSRDWVKSFWKSIAYNLPVGWRVCGENLYAKHSIAYDDLESYLYGFSIWNADNVCLSWGDTLEWFDLLGIKPVDVFFYGVYDEDTIRAFFDQINVDGKHEGYVIRLADAFDYEDFSKSTAKYVRKNHVTSNEHWMYQAITPNKLV